MILENKKIIITGGSSGIGRATAIVAAREGADISIADIDRTEAEVTAELVRAEGRTPLIIEMDTSKGDHANRMVEETLAKFNTVDGIVCGAIKLRPSALEELAEDEWDMVMDVGLKGYYLCAQAAGRVMLENGKGSIVFLSSVGGVQPYNGAGAYSVAKAGTIMLGNLFGVEWSNRGVRANTVIPGQVRTPMTEEMFSDPEISAGRASVVPMKRVGLPEEIAEVCVFLLSDRSSYVNAASIRVDGGLSESKLMHIPGRNWGGKKLEYTTD